MQFRAPYARPCSIEPEDGLAFQRTPEAHWWCQASASRPATPRDVWKGRLYGLLNPLQRHGAPRLSTTNHVGRVRQGGRRWLGRERGRRLAESTSRQTRWRLAETWRRLGAHSRKAQAVTLDSDIKQVVAVACPYAIRAAQRRVGMLDTARISGLRHLIRKRHQHG